MNNKLQLIDFSQGIKSTEIQHNFNALQEQLNKERISVAGAGISYGLDFKLTDFTLSISEGCLINNKGEEVYIDKTTIEIDKPILIEKIERQLKVNKYNRVYLKETPYAPNRLTISQNVDTSESGIVITRSGSEDKISLASIDKKILNLKPIVGSLENMSVDVRYNYTFKRRDIIFIDNNFKIQYRQGITSPSPSIPGINKEEYTYILGYIEVDGHHLNMITDKVEAMARVIKEFKSIRNVYTDTNNKLYLCGTPFESLKVIHLVEPENPEENTFWYDSFSNELKIWKATDENIFVKEYLVETSNPQAEYKFKTDVPYLHKGKQLTVYLNGTILDESQYIEGTDLTDVQKRESYIFSSEFQVLAGITKGDKISYRIERTDGFMEWVTINNKSYIEMEERLLWNPNDMEYEEVQYEHDKQHFFFHATKNKNCLFTPDKNCLEILVDQIPLHNDQFKEITMLDAIASEDASMIRKKLINYYGYNDEFDMQNIHEEYENIGVGFKLDAPLDKNTYVEVRVKHRVNTNPISKRFQRTATFVEENSFEYQQFVENEHGDTVANPPIFKTNAQYRLGENQLEVYLNGVRLDKDIYWREVKMNPKSLKAAPCDKFEILSPANLKNGDRVSYKITTSIYSYDNVEMLLSNFNEKIKECKDVVEKTKESIENTQEVVQDKIEIVETQIETMQQITNNLEGTYVKKTDIINKNNIDPIVTAGVMSNGFYHSITVTEARSYDITNICSEKDFTILFNLNDSNGNKILRRGDGEHSDYNIIRQDNSISLVLLSPTIQSGHILYLTGIKFGI